MVGGESTSGRNLKTSRGTGRRASPDFGMDLSLVVPESLIVEFANQMVEI